MNYGYARVSTDEQNLNLQFDALEHAGCDKIFRDEGVSEAVEQLTSSSPDARLDGSSN